MKTLLVGLVAVLGCLWCVDGYAKEPDKIGQVAAVKRIMQGDDKINVLAVDDPNNPFVTCYLTTVNSGEWFAMADPSNSSIACRLTGTVGTVDTSSNPNIYAQSLSILSKELRIARFYDAKRKVLVYVSYVTKDYGGSVKHSLSVVPLQ